MRGVGGDLIRTETLMVDQGVRVAGFDAEVVVVVVGRRRGGSST